MTRGLRVHTRVGDGSFIGTRAIIMPGVSIGKNCVVAPGSVVLTDITDSTYVRGNPADTFEPI
ncbi:MAG: acyltransferase [Novosphingobium sp.]